MFSCGSMFLGFSWNASNLFRMWCLETGVGVGRWDRRANKAKNVYSIKLVTMVANWSSVMLGNCGSQCIGHIQGVSVEGWGSWAIIHQLTIHTEFRTASCDIKPLKCLACFAHRPSMFSGQGEKKIKAFRQRTVSIPCKWLQCIEVNANKKKWTASH